MKRFLLSLFSMLLIMGSIMAQEPGKAYKAAKKAYSSYTLDPANKSDVLVTAREKIDVAINGIKDVDEDDRSKMWAMMGNIYNAMASNDSKMKLLNPEYQVEGNNAMSAYTGYKNALETAQKKWEKKDALNGLFEAANHLNNTGLNLYDAEKYADAYASFQALLSAHDILTANGNKSILQTQESVNDILYATGLCAFNANMYAEAAPVFEKLKAADYDKPLVYQALYKCYLESDEAKAVTMLEDGRKRFPDDVALLFDEINHYLKSGRLDELTGKLKMAIEKEPDNVSLYTTLGNVYDNLYQQEAEAGNEAKSMEYFDLAMQYYSQALEKDDKSFEAIYSLGALYYNQAAAISREMAELESDYSKEGMRKYDAKKAEVFAAFDKALPYFKKAEAIKADDRNTLIALKEIFAKKDDIVTSNEFKKRLETLDAGGKIEGSHFKN